MSIYGMFIVSVFINCLHFVLFCMYFLLGVNVKGLSRVGHCKLAKALNAVVCDVVYAILYTCPHTNKH